MDARFHTVTKWIKDEKRASGLAEMSDEQKRRFYALFPFVKPSEDVAFIYRNMRA